MGVSAKLKRSALTPTGLTETIMARIARHGPLKSYTTLLLANPVRQLTHEQHLSKFHRCCTFSHDESGARRAGTAG